MSCKDRFAAYADQMGKTARTAAGQVDGAARCVRPGCNELVRQDTGRCVAGHAQQGRDRFTIGEVAQRVWDMSPLYIRDLLAQAGVAVPAKRPDYEESSHVAQHIISREDLEALAASMRRDAGDWQTRGRAGEVDRLLADTAHVEVGAYVATGDTIYVWQNQGHRQATVLACLDGQMLVEYQMPRGTTGLMIFHNQVPGYHVDNVTYKGLPKRWIAAMQSAGTSWIGQPQQNKGEPVPMPERLAEADAARCAVASCNLPLKEGRCPRGHSQAPGAGSRHAMPSEEERAEGLLCFVREQLGNLARRPAEVHHGYADHPYEDPRVMYARYALGLAKEDRRFNRGRCWVAETKDDAGKVVSRWLIWGQNPDKAGKVVCAQGEADADRLWMETSPGKPSDVGRPQMETRLVAAATFFERDAEYGRRRPPLVTGEELPDQAAWCAAMELTALLREHAAAVNPDAWADPRIAVAREGFMMQGGVGLPGDPLVDPLPRMLQPGELPAPGLPPADPDDSGLDARDAWNNGGGAANPQESPLQAAAEAWEGWVAEANLDADWVRGTYPMPRWFERAFAGAWLEEERLSGLETAIAERLAAADVDGAVAIVGPLLRVVPLKEWPPKLAAQARQVREAQAAALRASAPKEQT